MNKRKEEVVESTMTKDDFTIDSMGRITIINNEELLEMISGGEFSREIYGEMKSSLFDSSLLELGNCGNCGCTGSGSGSGYCGRCGLL